MRAADNYWKGEYFKRRAGDATAAVCVSDKDPRSDAQKVVLPALGVVADYRGGRPLAVGEAADVTLTAAGDVV
jgi:hypothetical protein